MEVATNDGSEDISSYTIDHQWPKNIMEVGDKLDLAAHIIRSRPLGFRQKYGLGKKTTYDILEETSEPVLISRGSFPYKNILLAVAPGLGSLRVAELAVDVARKFEATLTVVAACPADLVAGEDFREEVSEAIDRATEIASLYGLATKTEVLEGNEVNQICQRAKDFDLLLTGHRRHRKFSFLKPDVSALLASRSPISTMVLPFLPRDLGGSYQRRAKKQDS